MSKRLAFVVALIISTSSYTKAQRSYDFGKVDPKKIDLDKLGEQIRDKQYALDSMYYASRLDSLNELYKYATTGPLDYTTVMFQLGCVFSDYGSFPDHLRDAGFPAVPGTNVGPSFAVGFAKRTKRFIFEYSLGISGAASKDDGGTSVEITGLNLLNLFVGFDVVNGKQWQLYTMALFSHHYMDADLHRNSPTPGSSSDLASLASQYDYLRLRQSCWNIGPALELDYRFFHSAQRKGTIVGIRFGVNYMLGQRKYIANGTRVDYNPNIDLRKSYVSVIFKPFDRS